MNQTEPTKPGRATRLGRSPIYNWMTVYQVTPPLSYTVYSRSSCREVSRQTYHVLVSVLRCGALPEVFLFPATPDGDALTRSEIYPGSYRGDTDHAIALRKAGYLIVEEGESS